MQDVGAAITQEVVGQNKAKRQYSLSCRMVRKSSAPQFKKRRPAKGVSTSKKKSGRGRKAKQLKSSLKSFVLLFTEWLGLTIVGIAVVIFSLGYLARQFSGTDLQNDLLPFAGGVLVLILLSTLLLTKYSRLRQRLLKKSPYLPPAIVITLTLLAGICIQKEFFTHTFTSYRVLVGGQKEVERSILAHQVYAAYRRLDGTQLKIILNRAKPFSKVIKEAASAYDIDIDLLMGLAAAESSYRPRESTDGGHGLFQITKIPTSVTKEVNTLFQSKERVMSNHRYIAFLAAATFKKYLNDMLGSLYLGLLAYNIGPANGGLHFIMKQYKATDFITIQPYLMQLPRDYPTRVLSYALAFRIQRKEGRLLSYEEGNNALEIQAIGIPGQ